MTKQENRIIIVKQTRESIKEINKHKPAVEVACTCGVKKNILYMYKCFYCGIFFCKKCGEEHFKKEECIKIKLPKTFCFWTASWPMRMKYVLQELIKIEKEEERNESNRGNTRRNESSP